MTLSKERKKQIRFVVNMYFEHLACYERALPIMVHKLPKALGNCKLVPYSKHMKKFKLSYEEMVLFAGSYDACTDYHTTKDRYIIFYNDIDETRLKSNRYRWNIAHELGHVCLKHLITYDQTKVYRSTLSKKVYDELEMEADCFAAYFLVPHVGLYVSHIITQNELKSICKISAAAAITRYSDYIAWYKQNNKPSKWDYHDKSLSKTYIKAKARKGCHICNYIIYDNFIKYCPICGSHLNYTLEEKMAKYPGVELDQYNRPEECFNCNNEEHLPNATFCMICGEKIINTCTNEDHCSHVNEAFPGNARFCPYCGSKSTYFEKGYLAEFDISEARIEVSPSLPAGFDSIADEDIPF